MRWCYLADVDGVDGGIHAYDHRHLLVFLALQNIWITPRDPSDPARGAEFETFSGFVVYRLVTYLSEARLCIGIVVGSGPSVQT